MTTADTDQGGTVAHPLDAGTLSDYWLGLLSPGDEEAVDLHLFECDACGTALREVIALAEGVRVLAQRGSLRMVITEAFARRVAETGGKVRSYEAAPGETVHCTVTEDDDLLVARLTADLRGARRVDVSVVDQGGVEHRRLTDIPFNAEARGLVFQESMTFAKASPSMVLRLRLLAVGDGDSERLIGDYTFSHTRSLPGPGAW